MLGEVGQALQKGRAQLAVEPVDPRIADGLLQLKGLVEQTKNSDRALYAVICCLVILLGFLTMMVLS